MIALHTLGDLVWRAGSPIAARGKDTMASSSRTSPANEPDQPENVQNQAISSPNVASVTASQVPTAESDDARPTKAKPKTARSKPITKITAENRVKQFPSDLYADSGVLFCQFCCHSLDMYRINTIKEHLISKVHIRKKQKAKPKPSQLHSHAKLQ